VARETTSSRPRGWGEALARWATHWTGTSWAFLIASGIIILWAATGPFVSPPFNNTWQLIINTSTTIVTFLMVFLIQRSQNIESQAVQLKLNELVAAVKGASNRLINVEDLSEEELQILHKHFSKLSELAKKEVKMTASHSVEEAEQRHERKKAPNN
jgi:low affinity Fe/Cu permease